MRVIATGRRLVRRWRAFAQAGEGFLGAGQGLHRLDQACFLVVRRLRRPTLKGRLEKMSPDSLRALADQVASRLKKPLPSVTVTVNEKRQDSGTLVSIVRKVAPAVVGTFSTALVERVARPPEDTRSAAH